MINKLSPKDFNSITEWIKQYIGMVKPQPVQKLEAPLFDVLSNTYAKFTYKVINPNEVLVNVFVGEESKYTIEANSSIELSYEWGNDQYTFNMGYKFNNEDYQDSDYSYLTVVRPEQVFTISIAQPTNGTITCNKTSATKGTNIVCSVTPNEGYQVDKFYVNDVESELSFTMPESNITLSADVSWIIYGILETPTIEIVSNDSTQLIYSIKNSNKVDVLFNGETVSASGALELTHIWGSSETSFLINGYFSAEHYINSAEVLETIDKPSAPTTMPVKGDLIKMSLGNATPAAGTQDLYRVLNISGSVAEVVAMYDISTSQEFSSSSQVYSGSSLDTALNTTWYGTLNDTAKAAIVDKTFRQDSWYWGTSGSPVYSGYYGTSNPGTTSYSVSLKTASFGSEITRKVYALSMQDVLDYVTDTSVGDGKLQNYNIWNLFWNTTSRPSNYTYPWLRSAYASISSLVWYVGGYGGCVDGSYYDGSYASRPAFKIDLSKIDYKIVKEN